VLTKPQYNDNMCYVDQAAMNAMSGKGQLIWPQSNLAQSVLLTYLLTYLLTLFLS